MKINPYKRFRYAITNLLHEGGSAYKKILKKRVHSKNSNPKLKQQNSNKPDNEHVSIINDLNLSAQNIIDNDETISVERLIDSLEVVNADEKITTVDISEKLILEQIEISREVITEQPVDTNESGLVNDKSIEEITLVKESITLNKTNLKDIEMTTVSGEDPHLPKEFEYLKTLVSYRLSNPGGSATPQIPPVSSWDLPVKEFILKHELNNDVAALILIGLVPHIIPELFDETIQKKIKSPTDDNDYPELGGIRGKNFRGFLPTGQTAIFLLAGNNWKKRFEIEQLFWSDKELAIKKILWLEQLEQGEPVASGKITIALDYVELFLYGTVAPPHFSTSFPAKKITTKLTVNDIVINDEVKKHFEDLKHSDKHKTELLDEWDEKKRFKKGLKVLLYGPPGTGKTLMANILGNEINKDVYKIDLSMVVSKYIGETEKNLELLFARAEDKKWILFFDEADAIFGKRTGVRDAHDKYANQEVSYLLQRIEDFNGLVILATNMKNNIDDAFVRRFDYIVKFTPPNENERKKIWELSFPPKAIYEDIPDKVKKYDLSGGNINNITHYAGIHAVKRRQDLLQNKEKLINEINKFYNEQDTHISCSIKFYLDDVIEGIKREMIKEGKPFNV